MGQTFSSSNNANKTPSTTPQRASNGAYLDPRSPSQDIERTPIQFNENSGPNAARSNNEEKASSSESTESSSTKEKTRKMSLRQRMFERKKNNENREEN